MRKRWMLVAALAANVLAGGAAQAQEASACNIETLSDPSISAVLARFGYAFENYDLLCASLADAGMGVALSGTNGVVSDRSYGLISVTLFDQASEISGNALVTATSLDLDITPEGGEQAQMRAINDALRLIATNPDHYITSVRAEVSRLQIHFSEQ
jgi:hypothetical protein